MNSRKHTRLTRLSTRARGIAACLSYNDSNPHVASAKHQLLEMARELDQMDIRVRERIGEVGNGLGKSRKMTLSERFFWKFFGLKPERV